MNIVDTTSMQHPHLDHINYLGALGSNNTFRGCLREPMVKGAVTYLHPDNPKDRRQRICLPKSK